MNSIIAGLNMFSGLILLFYDGPKFITAFNFGCVVMFLLVELEGVSE